MELVLHVFPCKIQYLDLTVLDLKNETCVPTLMFIGSEWDSMMKIIDGTLKGVQGSIVVTGQPGISLNHYFFSSLLSSEFLPMQNMFSVLYPHPLPHSITAYCFPRHK